jgi:hypothetical protein
MTKVLILVPKMSNRLRYIMSFIMEEQLGLTYELTVNQATFEQFQGPRFVYGDAPLENDLFFKTSSLLFERDILSQDVKPFTHEGILALFPVYHRLSALPFDIFSAAFYLLSRYEEYLPFVRDSHGRFEASSSILHQTGNLDKPVVDYWVRKLRVIFAERFSGLTMKQRTYTFVPTYDIDAAWSFLHKGIFRTTGAYLKDLSAGDWGNMKLRTSVLRKKQSDPFDTFDLQLSLQKEFKLRPAYFILFADYAVNDKNISVRNPYFHKLIRRLGDYAEVGIHPSYNSFMNKPKLKQEIDRLSGVLNRPVTMSRQHFLRMNLPIAYHNLIDSDITDDYTMGYASEPGFRAGVADSFQFYDLDNDLMTGLRVHPFQLMDGTLCDYLKLNPEAAIIKAKEIINRVREVDGTFISLWHNESLSDSKRWAGWLKVYHELIREALP